RLDRPSRGRESSHTDLDYILKHTQFIGEPASPIMRRLLGISATSKNGKNGHDRELLEFVQSPGYLAHGTATKRYLQVLAFAAKQKPGAAERLLSWPRRSTRLFFAKNKSDIEN